MKYWIFFVIVLFSQVCLAQLTLNSASGFYEYVVEIVDREDLFDQLDGMNVEMLENFNCKGSFSHGTEGRTPIKIAFLGEDKDSVYVFTNFRLIGGVTSAITRLEDLPKKHQMSWITVIDDKFMEFGLVRK